MTARKTKTHQCGAEHGKADERDRIMRDIDNLMRKLPPMDVRHGLKLALVLAGGNEYATHPVYSQAILREQMEQDALARRMNWWRRLLKRLSLKLRDWARKIEASL